MGQQHWDGSRLTPSTPPWPARPANAAGAPAPPLGIGSDVDAQVTARAEPHGRPPLDIAELRRLDALDALEILDTPAEPGLDRIVHLAARLFQVPVALICFLDGERAWIKARAGTALQEYPRAGSNCAQALLSSEVTVIQDSNASSAPWAAGPLGAGCRFYAGVPLTAAGGEPVGVLCLMDRRTHPDFSSHAAAILTDLAAIVSQQVEQRRRALALEHTTCRTARTEAMMHAVVQAPTCEQALGGLLSRLCEDHAAAAAYIWKLARPRHVLQEVSRNITGRSALGAHLDLARRLEVGPGSSLTADAILSGTPRAVRFAGVADLHRLPMVASAMRHGLVCQVVQPIQVAGERFAVTLSFDADRTDLDGVLADLASVDDAIRPALYRKVAEERMHMLRTALDRANDAVMITEAPQNNQAAPCITYVNASFCRAMGYAPDEVVGQSPHMLIGTDASPQIRTTFEDALLQRTSSRTEVEQVRRDGTRIWVEMDVTPIAGEGGANAYWVTIQRDVTERRAADQARKEREASNRTLFEQSPMPTFVFDRRTLRFLDVNGAAVRQYGWSRAQFLSMSLPDVQAADEQPAFGSLIATNQATEIGRRVWTHLRADGSRLNVTVASHTLTYAGEEAIMAVLQDVTEGEAAQRAMQGANARLADLAAQLQARTSDLTEVHRLAQLGAWRRPYEGSAVWSDEMFEIMGFRKSTVVPGLEEVLDHVHPDDRAAIRAIKDNAWLRAGGTGADVPRQLDFRVVLPGGGLRHCRLDARPMLDASGQVTGSYGYCQDITTHKQTELALLRSEKLKSIGQLTGGIAHDFNNLLTVVTLNLEEALETVAPGEVLHEILQPAMHAAARGAELTKQLLSYARRATLRPEQVRLSNFFGNLQPLLTRTIGKRYDLQLQMQHDGQVFIDPAQLENAIINLVINARDAMPEGGGIRLTTELARITQATASSVGGPTDDIAPGDYLLISVSDTGTGIPADVLSRVFEPFFTTKDVGQGSGLGLSMVYGFAKQSGGLAAIRSTPGAGTTVRLYLPAMPQPEAEAAGPLPWQRRGLRALVVDDDPDLLKTAARMLSNIGADVTTALTAEDAVARMNGPGAFNLLFSDVRLPGPVDGVSLAAQARRVMPGISVLLTSGYTDHSLTALHDSKGGLPGDTRFLPKPYTRQSLHAALLALLGPE